MASSVQLTRAEIVNIGIGGTAVRLRTEDSEFCEMLEKRYCGFLDPSRDPDFELDVELVEEWGAEPEKDVEVRTKSDEWILERGDFLARLQPNVSYGRVRQTKNPYAIDSVLRIVHSLMLASRGGFLVHAASAIRNRKGFLFAGVSGAGKTTISRLAPPDCTLLSDEISYVRREGSDYIACGTPFSGELGRPGTNCSARLHTLFLLYKGDENRVESVRPVDAVRLLLRNILFFAHDAELVRLVFQSACDFAHRVPVKKLIFRPDASAWDLACGRS